MILMMFVNPPAPTKPALLNIAQTAPQACAVISLCSLPGVERTLRGHRPANSTTPVSGFDLDQKVRTAYRLLGNLGGHAATVCPRLAQSGHERLKIVAMQLYLEPHSGVRKSLL